MHATARYLHAMNGENETSDAQRHERLVVRLGGGKACLPSDAKIVAICAQLFRSAKAAETIEDQDFIEIFEFELNRILGKLDGNRLHAIVAAVSREEGITATLIVQTIRWSGIDNLLSDQVLQTVGGRRGASIASPRAFGAPRPMNHTRVAVSD